jgi:hypothetical protein
MIILVKILKYYSRHSKFVVVKEKISNSKMNYIFVGIQQQFEKEGEHIHKLMKMEEYINQLSMCKSTRLTFL